MYQQNRDGNERTVQELKDRVSTLEEILFGDGEDKKGLILRLTRAEDSVKTFWTSLGFLGSAAVVGIVNLVFDLLRGK